MVLPFHPRKKVFCWELQDLDTKSEAVADLPDLSTYSLKRGKVIKFHKVEDRTTVPGMAQGLKIWVGKQ